ncbi:hypothetical protein [Hyalangium versicolor]|uniref:hypothetical protein n=1 Tax=Hyalangium versicolor TaxID=2861190 RepID=UPI001CCA1210|nr:hypothetical protein [Hyalangium versicolor]
MARKKQERHARRAEPTVDVRTPFRFPEPRQYMVAEALGRAEKAAANLEQLLKEIAPQLMADRASAWQKPALEHAALQLVSLRLQLRGHQAFYVLEVGRG